MATSTTTARWPFIKALKTACDTDPNATVITRTPGDDLPPDCIWIDLGSLEGTFEVAGITGTRPEMHDDFRVEINFRVASCPLDEIACGDRINALITLVLDVLQEHGDIDDIDGLTYALPEQLAGPAFEHSASGVIGFAQLTVNALSTYM